MVAWKAYAWEREKFPWHYRVKIRPEFAAILTRKLAARFNIQIGVHLTNRSWGRYYSGLAHYITLPASGCSFGMICHEIAHAHNSRVNGGHGHTGTFRRSLIKIMVEARPMLASVFGEVRRELLVRATESQKQADRAQRQAQRLREAKDRRRSPEWRLTQAQTRAKALRTRIKRLGTALKKAERQVRALQRVVAARSESSPQAL